MVGFSLAVHTVAPVCSINPIGSSLLKHPVSSDQPQRSSFLGKPCLAASCSFSGSPLLPVRNGSDYATRDGRSLVTAATGPSGNTPTLHVGRLWLKQVSKAGQGKQNASGPKTKGDCRRLCPPTATVSVETRPLLQKPFTLPHAMEMQVKDEKSYTETQSDAVPAHAAWLTYRAAISDDHTSNEYAVGVSNRLATLAEYRMMREQSLLSLQAIRAAAFEGQTGNDEN
ncbi:hypothetical protein KFL_000640010 [Klebsormidium nitens]|uniref:Uncharacterized protein n=1 Tax=Klebsormidium nitens TaxID=105231 RepID=A0A1Y1HQC9_KLENI|nr:hypothetical protein KFL_000640010 [Klebsormidium nitens]|eukprot:GAQ80835.1 hypothetical protein KFL_000640010 [Klebsormidium nitens]